MNGLEQTNTLLAKSVVPSGNINHSLGTGDHNHVIDGVYDSGIWDPDASGGLRFDEENLETHKPLDDDIDDVLADDEGRVFRRPDVQYKSYRVNGQDVRADADLIPMTMFITISQKNITFWVKQRTANTVVPRGSLVKERHSAVGRGWVKRSPHLDLGLIKLIVRILEGNPYVGTFRSLGSKPNLDEYRIELNTKIAYPLFYPGGEAGWNEGILYQETKKKNKTGKKKKKTEDPDEDFPSAMDIDDEAEADRTGGQGGDPESNKKYVSAREYYAYKLQIRRGEFNVLFYGGRLFQQWLVDMYIKVESMRLNWYSLPAHQKIIRADLYQGVLDTLATGEARASLTGKRIVLPRSMTGCDRDVQTQIP
ncbi:hypothetical protein EJB05_16308 [Eragrostis curvula]|uniref:Helitron helicase-like domain-containing protein n=1 Tax=Eragrostis curvula TaxID=38414 RepID=A0A5J9VEJ9_9POAL|nr:hypothetical protein EJB05_16308 [Eragrostis curvula]